MVFAGAEMLSGRRFLVTGVAGFIGSNLAEALLDLNCHIRGLDNFSTGTKQNLVGFDGHPNFEFVEGDIRDMATCLRACNGIEYVLHQAAWGSVPRSITMPLEYEEINIKGTLNMMEAARRSGVKKFVYASSSSVYGDDPHLPRVEGREGRTLSPYALTKRVNEEYGALYAQLYGLETYGLRYFNVFGKRQNPAGAYAAVIPKFISQLSKDESPVIFGDGTQSRDFTAIQNVVDANLRACVAPTAAAGGVFNVASGVSIPLIEVYESLCRLLGKEIAPVYESERLGDVKHSWADLSRSKEILGYQPQCNFHKGLEEYLGWFERRWRGELIR